MHNSSWQGPDSDPEKSPAVVPLDSPPDLDLHDDPPPVEPPSAGLIVQLFLVPALIVGAILAVYALFGQLASQELDWRQQLRDVTSANPTLQGRGALGLAQILEADAARGSRGQNLAAQPEIATALGGLYSKLVPLPNLTPDQLGQVEYLSKALGRLQSTDIVAPILRDGIQPQRNAEIRRHSLIGLAMLAGSARSAGHSPRDDAWTEDLIAISRESELLMRHQATFALGLMEQDAALARLVELLDDPDPLTQANAAVGLARHQRLESLPVFHQLLQDGAEWKLDPAQVHTIEEESRYFERMLLLTNVLKAVRELASALPPNETTQFARESEAVSTSTQDAVLRTEARSTLNALRP